MTALRRGTHFRRLLLPLAVVALWFGFLGVRALYFPDEGRYAEIPREMLASGDWVTPRLDGIAYFEKPPFQYWATAAVFALGGEHEWTARLWPALAGFAALIAVFLTTRRLFGKRAGWMAAAIMSSCWGYFVATQFVTLDMTLTALMTAALCAFLVAQDVRTGARGQRGYMLVAWTMCALAVLTKGVIGIALPVLALAVYIGIARDLQLLRRLHVAAGASVFAVIVVPWFVLAEARNPGFADFFFIHEHLERYLRPEHRRPGPWYYFVPIAIVFLLPWFPAIVSAIARTRGSARVTTGVDARKFAWCSAAAIFVFFSLSSSKLPAYIMPAIGAVAIAAAVPLARRFDDTLRATAWTLAIAGVLAAGLAYPAGAYIKVALVREQIAGGEPWVLAAAFAFTGGAVVAHLLRRRRRPLAALATLALASMLGCQLASMLVARADDYFSAKALIERVVEREARRPLAPGVAFYSVDMFDHTVPFYLRRTVTLVHDESELAWGIARDPSQFVPTMDEFARRWREGGDAYAVMERDTYDKLAAEGFPMREVGTDGRRFVVARR